MWVSGVPMGCSCTDCELLIKIVQDMHELPTKWDHEPLPIFDALLSTFDLLQEPREKKRTGGNSLKHKEIDGDSPPRKRTTNRRKAVIFDSDEEWMEKELVSCICNIPHGRENRCCTSTHFTRPCIWINTNGFDLPVSLLLVNDHTVSMCLIPIIDQTNKPIFHQPSNCI